ncbi:MAG: GlxA family transcriptional regulator [Motiliproteus sp.]|nr:GlxA family transcriptional regulator [Motiliproteus sp.]MCW9052065.1 GlxA family transcriptional regulator [Motiliproteus sp.]
MPSKTIRMFAYKNCQLLDVCGPLQVFASANSVLNQSAYDVAICAEAGGAIATNSGITVNAPLAIGDIDGCDTLLVAGGSGVFEQLENTAVIDWVKSSADNTNRLGSVCTGAFILAACGLLDGRRAVTHWRHHQQLQLRFPAVKVEADALYLHDSGIYTSAGVTAGIDLALSLVAEDHGHAVAAAVAKDLVVFMHRPGGQSQFSNHLAYQTDPARLNDAVSRTLDHIQHYPDTNLDIDALAEVACLSPRHLTRLFRQQLGQTPISYVEEYRLSIAQEHLEHTRLSLEQIAEKSGFSSAEQLRRVMKRRRGLTPAEYRQRFADPVYRKQSA